MPDLPQLADVCPDTDCRAPIGTKHRKGCTVAICLSTGVQRALHENDDTLLPTPGLTIDVDVHICGDDRWGGWPRGTVEAIEHGMFVQPAAAAHSAGTPGWVRCEAGDPGAVPDIARVLNTGVWDPVRQTWKVAAHGRREKWALIDGVGGYVCAEPDPAGVDGICGMPVESEPCNIHHPEVGAS